MSSKHFLVYNQTFMIYYVVVLRFMVSKYENVLKPVLVLFIDLRKLP